MNTKGINMRKFYNHVTDFFEILGSLGRPFAGFIAMVFTGEFGRFPITGVLKQILLQAACLSMLMGVSGTSLVVSLAFLVLFHFCWQFVVILGYAGAAFGGQVDKDGGWSQYGVMALCWMIGLSLIPTLVIFLVVGSGGIIAATAAFLFSLLGGAAIDTLAGICVLEKMKKASEDNQTRAFEENQRAAAQATVTAAQEPTPATEETKQAQ
jgi:hypothetical protein